jgi:hypothetical protein
MVTHDTTKLSLALAVTVFGVSTRAASLATVGWINQLKAHASALRLVANKHPQLSEGPIVVSCSLPRPLNPRPLTDALEVFKDDRPLRAFGFGNETLADDVFRIFLKASLATCKSFHTNRTCVQAARETTWQSGKRGCAAPRFLRAPGTLWVRRRFPLGGFFENA